MDSPNVLFLYIALYFHDSSTTNFYFLSLHDALPIWGRVVGGRRRLEVHAGIGDSERPHLRRPKVRVRSLVGRGLGGRDRKSTRLNSSHVAISYAVFCLKKKKDIIDCT